MGFKTKVRESFKAARKDLVKTREGLSGAVFSLSNEFTKLTLKIQELEKKVAELEGRRIRSFSRAEYGVKP